MGIQEKATFVQAFSKPASLFAPVMWLPAFLQLLLLLAAMAVLFHHAHPADSHQRHRRQQQQQHEPDGGEHVALVEAQLSDVESPAAGGRHMS